jgi:hypothetical protein
MATDANSENARSRMEASFAWKREYGSKGRGVKYWAHLGCWISPCFSPFLLGRHFETYKPFILGIHMPIMWACECPKHVEFLE